MAQSHAQSGQVVSLRPLGASIGSARTTALLKAEQLEVMRVVLLAGKELREHQAPGESTVLCLEGQIEFSTRGGSQTLGAGDWVHLSRREPHALRALTDASALVTLCISPQV